MHETLKIEQIMPFVELVTLNRPEVLNAINTQLASDLRDYFQKRSKDKSGRVRTVILTGAGDKSFCAGADLKERKSMTDAAWFKQHKIFEDAGLSITACTVPVIAAVNGLAYGGGCELAMACDMIFAATTATFAQPEVKLGIIPGLGGTQRLPRLVGINRAKELLFTGRQFSPREALEWGLVNQIVEPKLLIKYCSNVAKEIIQNGPVAIRELKKAVNEGFALPILEALATELKYYMKVAKSKDRREGILAFNERRSPQFLDK